VNGSSAVEQEAKLSLG